MKKPVYEELGINQQWMKNLIFAGIFIQENKLHTVFDRYNEVSSKQWLLMTIIASFDTPPDLTSLAGAMGCSRQNVKKLAQNLEKNGYVELCKSETDARTLCLKLTVKGRNFRKTMEKSAEDVHNVLFQDFTEKQIEQYYKLSIKIMKGIEYLDEFFKNSGMKGAEKDDEE